MRWFRLRQKWGTCLALAALLIQLVVASGHVHLDAADHDHRQIEHVDAHADLHPGDADIASASHEREPPGIPHAPDRNHCAACALIHLAQSLIAPTVPALALPDSFDRQPVTPSTAALTAPEAARFRARAPPIA